MVDVKKPSMDKTFIELDEAKEAGTWRLLPSGICSAAEWKLVRLEDGIGNIAMIQTSSQFIVRVNGCTGVHWFYLPTSPKSFDQGGPWS